MTKVTYSDLLDAFDFGAADDPDEHAAYLSLDTGKFYWVSDWHESEDEVPDDLETSDRYLPMPGKRELDLGKYLALRFVEEELPDLLPRASDIFRHKGAYARFKDLLESKGALQQWYRYEADATKEALLRWCAEHGVEVEDT